MTTETMRGDSLQQAGSASSNLEPAVASGMEREAGAERPRRVQLRRTKDWRLPLNTVVVSRPSKWGNPFKVTPERSQLSAVGAFRIWLTTEGVTAGIQERKQWMLDHMPDLRGKNLACWCSLNSACHADVLLSLVGAGEETANGTREKTQNEEMCREGGGETP